jgi:phosphosulfolactate phosphohydrolase-like enzyme
MREIGADADFELCARVDVSRTVPIARSGRPLRIEPIELAYA